MSDGMLMSGWRRLFVGGCCVLLVGVVVSSAHAVIMTMHRTMVFLMKLFIGLMNLG